jgi:hypothetical protein
MLACPGRWRVVPLLFLLTAGARATPAAAFASGPPQCRLSLPTSPKKRVRKRTRHKPAKSAAAKSTTKSTAKAMRPPKPKKSRYGARSSATADWSAFPVQPSISTAIRG